MAEYTLSRYPLYVDPTGEHELMPTNGSNPVTLSFIEWLAATEKEKQDLYSLYRDYYEGDHPTMLTDRLREFLEINADVDFRLNVCPTVVDVQAERLTVTGFESSTEDSRIGGEDGILWQWWTAARMDGVQNDVHTAAVRDGDTYVLTEWDNENDRPRWYHELAYDGTSGIVVRYHEDKPGEIKYAIKRWRVESGPQTGSMSRMNVYTEDAIYKYVTSRSGQWVEFTEEGQPWPIPWIDAQGEPLGIPIAHFKHAAAGYDFGKSALAEIVPCQDALNKSVLDELAAADVQAFRWIFKMGGGDPVDMEIGPGRIMWDQYENTKWEVSEAGGLDAISGLVRDWVMRAAQISRTPLSYFQITGQVASSDTLKADDKGLVSKVEKAAVSFGNAWEDAAYMALRLSNAFGSGDFDTSELISAQWNSFEVVDQEADDRERAETARIKSETFERLVNMNVDRRTAALLAGYTQEEADDMAEEDRRLVSDQVSVEPFGLGDDAPV